VKLTQVEQKLFVVFEAHERGPDGKAIVRTHKRALGPYRVVQVSPDGVFVFDGLTPSQLASPAAAGGWHAHDGMGEDSHTWESFLVLSGAADPAP
jgi:hypothetical protein